MMRVQSLIRPLLGTGQARGLPAVTKQRIAYPGYSSSSSKHLQPTQPLPPPLTYHRIAPYGPPIYLPHPNRAPLSHPQATLHNLRANFLATSKPYHTREECIAGAIRDDVPHPAFAVISDWKGTRDALQANLKAMQEMKRRALRMYKALDGREIVAFLACLKHNAALEDDDFTGKTADGQAPRVEMEWSNDTCEEWTAQRSEASTQSGAGEDSGMGRTLRKDYRFKTCREAGEFVKRMAAVADLHNHHPEALVAFAGGTNPSCVTVRTITHDVRVSRSTSEGTAVLAAQPTDEDDYSLFDLITIDSNWDQVKEKLGKTRKAEGAGLTRHDFLLAYVLDIEAREVVGRAGGKS